MADSVAAVDSAEVSDSGVAQFGVDYSDTDSAVDSLVTLHDLAGPMVGDNEEETLREAVQLVLVAVVAAGPLAVVAAVPLATIGLPLLGCVVARRCAAQLAGVRLERFGAAASVAIPRVDESARRVSVGRTFAAADVHG